MVVNPMKIEVSEIHRVDNLLKHGVSDFQKVINPNIPPFGIPQPDAFRSGALVYIPAPGCHLPPAEGLT